MVKKLISEKFILLREARSQFIGFNLAKQGFSILELVSSMGLSEAEWILIKEGKNKMNLSDESIKEIDHYFQV